MANFSSNQKYLDKYGLSLFWDKVRQYIQNQIGGIDGTDIKLYPSGETNPTVTDQIEKLWNSIGSGLGQYVKDIQHADPQTTPLKVVVNEGIGDNAGFYTVTLEDNGLANTLSDLTSNRVSSLTPENGGGSITLEVNENKGDVTLTINSQELTNKVSGLETTINEMVKSVDKAENGDGTYVKLNIDPTTGDVKLSINDQSLVSELTSIKNNLVLIPGSGEGTGMMSHGFAEVDGDYSVSFGYHSFNRGLISLTSGSKTEANADLTHAEGYDTKAGRMADIIDINSCTIDLVKASTRKAEIAELLNTAVEEGLISYDGVFDESNVLDYITNNHDTVIRYFGIGAHVEGKESQALGTASHAEGESTQAGGNASHAEGKNTIASGHESHAEGQDTRARGHQSHAEGIATVASGTNAHAEGDSTRASGYASHAEGISTIASGTNTHAEGELTQAIGNDSHAEGYGTQATGNQSHAEGDTTQAIGNDSHAGGNGSIAEGDRSFAHGDAVQAKGANALALGKNSIAGGHNSIAAGHESQTNNTRSFAMGYICSTGGNDSMSFGYECSTGAAKSAAIGNRAKTTNIGEFACGNYNATSDTQLFSVGCGTNNTNRKNAFHVINNSGTIKAYVDNKEISVVGHTHNPSDLGLSGAMKYCGKTTTTLSDGDTTNPIVIDGSNFTAVAGNVVIDNNNHKEFIWDGSKWELLGDEGSYKIKQSIVNDPTASGTSTTFIDTISQDVNGKITVTKKNIPSIGEMNVQSDWSETDTNSDAYIKNKPTIPTNTSQLTNNNQTFIGRTDGIISNTDADNFTDSGAYLFQTGNGENNTNFPITGYGILNVFNSPYSNRTTNYIGQLLLGTYSIFYRTKVDTWSDWKRIALTSDIPTKLSQLTDDVVDGKYLPITGGIINTAATTPLNIKNTQSNPTEVGIRFMYNNDSKAWIGYNTQNGTTLFTYNGNHRLGIKDDGTAYVDSNTLIHSGNIGSYNAGSATKLQTPRKLWGNDFDGTADVSGNIISPRFETTAFSASTPKRKAALDAGGLIVYGADNSGWASGMYTYNPDDNTNIGTIAAAFGSSSYTPRFYYYGGAYNDPYLKIYQTDRRIISSGLFMNIGKEIAPYSSNRTEIALINPNAEPSMLRLGSNEDVKWSIETRGSTDDYAFSIYSWTAAAHFLRILNNGNVGIGTTSPTEKLDVAGNVKANGFIGNASSATVFGSNDFKVYAENSNEINFGGTAAKTNVYFGYRDKDGIAVPQNYYFGSSGSATVVAGNVKANNFIGNASSASKLANYYTSRPSSANLTNVGDGAVSTFKATSNMSIGTPPVEGHILHFEWDNAGLWNSQLCIANNDERVDGEYLYPLRFRTQAGHDWDQSTWHKIALINETHANALINSLSVGASDATLDDYIICQYAGGGTTTNTYHRRKLRNLLTVNNYPGINKTGTVTSVGLSMPTGFSVSSSPITSSGTLSVSFASGYSLPTTAKQTNWDTAYGWGNHASAGYKKTDTNYYHTRSYSSGLQISTGTGVSNMYVPYATASQAGVVSTGSQTFAGAKTFNSTVTASAFYISSDERLKTFGDDIKVDFDELAKLRKSHFVFNNNPTKQEIGVSAQEVQKIYPEIVNETEEGTLSVDYSKLAVVALAAIDKLNQRVQELENKLSKYE